MGVGIISGDVGLAATAGRKVGSEWAPMDVIPALKLKGAIPQKAQVMKQSAWLLRIDGHGGKE